MLLFSSAAFAPWHCCYSAKSVDFLGFPTRTSVETCFGPLASVAPLPVIYVRVQMGRIQLCRRHELRIVLDERLCGSVITACAISQAWQATVHHVRTRWRFCLLCCACGRLQCPASWSFQEGPCMQWFLLCILQSELNCMGRAWDVAKHKAC